MADETRKTNALRDKAFFDTYLTGKVVDIGCGVDKVTPDAKAFDLADGDAQHIAEYLPAASFDCVYSSHCLEHMRDVPAALSQWWSLVKPGKYMILVIPDEDLYEQGIWPSIFNDDHKATFKLSDGKKSWSTVSYDIDKLVAELESAEVLRIQKQNEGYNFKLQGVKFNKLGRKILGWTLKNKSNAKQQIGRFIYEKLPFVIWDFCVSETGFPVDQTRGKALAQIELIVKKKEA